MSGFKEILVLGSGRSGSNLLSSILGKLRGNASFYEIMIDDRIPVPTSYQAIIRNLLDHYGVGGDTLDVPDMLQARNADPVAFYDALAGATQKAGFASMSCKIFSHQISLDHLEVLLRRPNLAVIFLTRRRIDRYISGLKGQITNTYAKKDTTDLRPALNLRQFLRQTFKLDTDLDAMQDRVVASGVPHGYLVYERDLDTDPHVRLQNVSSVLQSVGRSADFADVVGEEIYSKQDANHNWRSKIENGFEISAALAGLGLSDWAESAPMSTSIAHRPVSAAPVTAPRDPTLLDRYSNYCLLSSEPLITFSAIDNDRSYLAEWMAGPAPVFPLRRGLHFVKPTWSMETSPLGPLVASFRRAEACNPGHRFVVLHATEVEAGRYRAVGQVSLGCNSAIFTNEAHFVLDAEPMPGIAKTDALYIARFANWKNHHWAAALSRPLFVYAEPKADEALRYEEVQRLCPSAQFANHLAGNGTYRYFNRAELNAVMSCARVSLALSTVEGFMRASAESLLAGLPVVSVAASGGRDACYTSDNSLIVEPSAEAVKAGVIEMLGRNITREEVRRSTTTVLMQARRAFLEGANRLVQAEFGPTAPEITLEPLLDFSVKYRTLGNALELMK